MRDAFGSTFMFKIIIIFIVAYVSFMTIAVNYAKTFRIKNGVINILEQYQYEDEGSGWLYVDVLNDYLLRGPYKVKSSDVGSNHCDGRDFIAEGVCVKKNDNYYVVTVYMVAKFPFLDLKLVIPISGETEDIN